MDKPNLRLACVGDYSIVPKYICKDCGQELYIEKSQRTGWKEWLVTKKCIRHFKTRCNLKDLPEFRKLTKP